MLVEMPKDYSPTTATIDHRYPPIWPLVSSILQHLGIHNIRPMGPRDHSQWVLYPFYLPLPSTTPFAVPLQGPFSQESPRAGGKRVTTAGCGRRSSSRVHVLFPVLFNPKGQGQSTAHPGPERPQQVYEEAYIPHLPGFYHPLPGSGGLVCRPRLE